MSIRVGLGLSTEKNHFKAAKEATNQAEKMLGSIRVDLAVVFSSIQFAYANTPRIIAGLLGDIPIIGCSSLAVISGQGVFRHGLAIMLLSLTDNIYFSSGVTKEISKKSITGAGEELGEKLLYGFKSIPRVVGVVLSDGLIPQSSQLLTGLQHKLGSSFPLAGASASDNLAFQKTFVYFNREVLNNAACGILLGGKFSFGLGVKHGWQPLGKPHIVTRSNGNVVYEIDGAPASRMYEDYFACDLNKLRQELKRISILYPIGIYLPGEYEYLLRNILSVENNGSLVCQGDIAQDSQIRLMIGTKESCLSSTQQAIEEVKKGLRGHISRFILIFESVSRYTLLGRQVNKELGMIKNAFSEGTPIIGIYTYGEQAPLRALNYEGKTHFHNQTITILGIGE